MTKESIVLALPMPLEPTIISWVSRSSAFLIFEVCQAMETEMNLAGLPSQLNLSGSNFEIECLP